MSRPSYTRRDATQCNLRTEYTCLHRYLRYLVRPNKPGRSSVREGRKHTAQVSTYVCMLIYFCLLADSSCFSPPSPLFPRGGFARPAPRTHVCEPQADTTGSKSEACFFSSSLLFQNVVASEALHASPPPPFPKIVSVASAPASNLDGAFHPVFR
ncbi:hypothetical protein GGR53DRAFT_502917 [Hypoxylon sp. FL1150]|nr:hypothetical protein GGR53DRAFT_502917 [Hypoxylon sp. FL1150]